MHYVDLLFSFVLFCLGVFSFVVKRFKTNFWVKILALIFFPVSVFSIYLPGLNTAVFGNVMLLDIVLFPFIKLLILIALANSIARGRREKKEITGV